MKNKVTLIQGAMDIEIEYQHVVSLIFLVLELELS